MTRPRTLGNYTTILSHRGSHEENQNRRIVSQSSWSSHKCFLSLNCIGKARYRIDESVRTERNDACSRHPLFPIAALRNPIREHSALAMPDVSLPPQANARHKPLRRTNVRRQIGDAVQQTESVAE